MIRHVLSLSVLLSLGAAGASADPLAHIRGGHPHAGGGGGGGGVASACDVNSTGVCAQHQNGQTFVTWPDAATGAPGANFRYRLYRSTTGVITSGNYASATLIASYIFNNSGQLQYGDPTNSTTSAAVPFTQAFRQTSTRPMVPLTVAGHALAYGDGLQAYTALGTADAYYAIVSTNASDASPSFIGSVGPIAESVATPAPIKVADSARSTIGKITGSTTNRAIVFNAHASGASAGCSIQTCYQGDYYVSFQPPDGGWQDGRQATLDIQQDTPGSYPSLAADSAGQPLLIRNRDSYYRPDGVDGTVGIESNHVGVGLLPNPLACPNPGLGRCDRFYRSTMFTIQRQLNWAVSHYGADPNRIHWDGQSLGAIGGTTTGLHSTNPKFAALWLRDPTWDLSDTLSPYKVPGTGWAGSAPAYVFSATIATTPWTLGLTTAAVKAAKIDDGVTSIGGTGGFLNGIDFLSNPANDAPPAIWTISKDDSGILNTTPGFQHVIDVVSAFNTGKHFECFVFDMGNHDEHGEGACDRDGTAAITAVTYSKPQFALNLPYVAFNNSSIDDNLGTNTRDSNHVLDGDYVGCIGCGFTWNFTTDTSGAVAFTVGNNWMTRNPTYTTTPATTTLTSAMLSSGTAAFTVTSGAVFQSTATGSANVYFLIGGTEIIKTGANSVSGNTVTPAFRGTLSTVAQTHAIGESVKQLISLPTGPNGGPYSSMTVDLTPRRLQNFIKTNGTGLTCTVTPFGASPTTQTPTVANGVFTLPSVTINSGGTTSVSCV